ncbi:TMhelix containing protein [Vibrio phage 1.069.O._10N.286.49.F11]|uniref:TMhelix containing protein n=7 Tax=Autolykiviridae TaxID=2184034 RepID=A0A2I7S839_9VIRU|nr:TMhelix containing protein [Vibrio phage 1.008.O._10N.286.54.E5]AUR81639.1 TMhelix containing protein [Vibrio phage 1.011.O._10N.286.49.B11]AUR83778.1 TMhelix containing protein [Vibrio phage 1.040.O._10N.286.45.B9]AUR84657.1 TMhelix containing protein [Vibrio phage 1.062.O._10N.286.55.C3]AUR85154.1 TMhelix containing protein [Vibrio phage 1.069.O._10N.286.49.F11]AUR89582.1 TMhelix containing protein [Vibrio phage 1.125.O._10N.286.49.F5]AUS02071.1 TMhelix containing protein [Vibrio phage 2
MPKKYMPYAINAIVAATTAYLVTSAVAKQKQVVWYNPTTWL